jgi:hypothetical protein
LHSKGGIDMVWPSEKLINQTNIDLIEEIEKILDKLFERQGNPQSLAIEMLPRYISKALIAIGVHMTEQDARYYLTKRLRRYRVRTTFTVVPGTYNGRFWKIEKILYEDH